MTGHCPVCDALLPANAEFCPACGNPAANGTARMRLHTRRLVRTRKMILINCLVCEVSLLGMGSVPTAAVAAPIIVAMSLLLLVIGHRARYTAAVRLGLAQVGVLVLLLAMVAVRPPLGDAIVQGVVHFAFLLVGAVALFITSLHAWQNHPAFQRRWECQECGYILRGLIRPRCPECGTPFDPRRLEKL